MTEAPSEGRRARISRDTEESPIGVAIFLTVDELVDLGIDPETAKAVIVSVEDQHVRLQSTESS